MSGKRRGSWGKYLKHYQERWENEKDLKDWIEPSPEKDVVRGKPEARCKVCDVFLRAHHGHLLSHAKTKKHVEKMKSLDRTVQPSLQNFDRSKDTDLKMSAFVAMHTSIQSIDHLGELLKELGEGSPLQHTRLHRTKCSRLISAVIAPSFMTELIADIGDSPYSLIIDEATDISVTKFMGICVKYYSQSKRKMVSDFLGLVQVTDCTGKGMAGALIEYLNKIGLPLKNLESIGTDGASAMCGVNNSLYTHLKKEVPHLKIFKCICHSIDKCAQHAFSKMPDSICNLIADTNNWFAHSALRKDNYEKYYETTNPGKKPKKLMSLSTTRWLVWLPVSEIIFDDWYELGGFFQMSGGGTKGDAKAAELAAKYKDDTNLLYIVFLKTILRGVQKVSFAFERTDADVTQLYSDLRTLVFSLANRILKPTAIPTNARPGMLRVDEVTALRQALANTDNLLPTDRVQLGDTFTRTAQASKVPGDRLNAVRLKCEEYIFTLCKLLLDKLPPNLESIKKLKFLTPQMALSKQARPTFQQLPTENAAPGSDLDALDSQWIELGTLSFPEVCPTSTQTVETIDIVDFWTGVLHLKNAGNEQPFKELALFALKCLTIPVSNAVVERAFSVMNILKTKRRNRMQLLMLDALMRLRIHMKACGICCITFKPSQDMIRRFTSSMYNRLHEEGDGNPVFPPAEEELVDVDDPEERTDVLPEEDYRFLALIDATEEGVEAVIQHL